MSSSDRITVEPQSLRFKSSQEEDFRKALEVSERYSLFHPISAVREILPDRHGCTVDNYRLTTWALFQVCQAACPGLYRFFQELMGVYRGPDEPRSDYSVDDALGVLHMVVRRRFANRLQGKQVLRNTRDRVIEGVVGSQYRWLPNLEMYSKSRTALKEVCFHEGLLIGRWMLVRFYRPEPLFSLQWAEKADPFYTGYHFSNNEVGFASARAATLVVRANGRTAALSPFVVDARLRHQGTRFDSRVSKLMAITAGKTFDPTDLRDRALFLRSQSLRLGVAEADREQKRRDDLVNFLTRHKVKAGLATRVVLSMLTRGSYDEEAVPLAQVDESTLRQRNAYDLFNAIGREAKRMPIGLREEAEQAAFSLLTGRITLH